MNKSIIHCTISPCDNERRIFNEAFTASRNGYQVAIVALKTPDLPVYSTVNSIPLERIAIKNWQGGPLKFLLFNLKLFFSLMHKNFQILHCHDLWVLPAAALAVCLKRGRLVYDAHEYYRDLEIFQKKKMSGFLWAVAEWIFIRKAEAVIVINRHHLQFFRRSYPFLKQVVVLMNYPFLTDYPSEKSEIGFDGRENKIIFQGILKQGRGLPALIQSMEKVETGTLEIIGHGELESELRKLVAAKNLQNLIFFKGKMEWDKLLRETGKCRAGLVLFQSHTRNYAHASPNKFFEYVMTGTPVIASDIVTFQEFNSEFEVALLVPPDSIDEISSAIRTLLNDQFTWKRLHENCIKARKKWNWEAQEKVLLDVYQQVLLS